MVRLAGETPYKRVQADRRLSGIIRSASQPKYFSRFAFVFSYSGTILFFLVLPT